MKGFSNRFGQQGWIGGWFAPLACILSTTVLYTLAFPPFGLYQTAFVCFIPFIAWSFFRPRFRIYAGASFVTSFLCWAATMQWLHNLGSHLGNPIMTLGPVPCCALVFAPFHWLWYLLLFRLQPSLSERPQLPRTIAALALAGAWVILEWARETFLKVQWNTLSSVLWEQHSLLQPAAFTGAWGLSFYIVFFNLGIALYVRHLLTRTVGKRTLLQRFCPEFYLVFGLLGLVFLTLFHSLEESGRIPPETLLKAAAIQPNISQTEKMDPAYTHPILDTFDKGMASVLDAHKESPPDLFLWPESATPLEAVGNSPYAIYIGRRVQQLVEKHRVPLLMGNMEVNQIRISLSPEPGDPTGLDLAPLENLPGKFPYWNAPPPLRLEMDTRHGEVSVKPSIRRDGSLRLELEHNGHFKPDESVQISYNIMGNGIYLKMPGKGTLDKSYQKQRLVPFGEYVPMSRLFPFLKKIVQVEDEFQPGLGSTPIPFETKQGTIRIGALVCYEDVFSFISREHALAGADCIFVATNDGWYGQSGAAQQHAAHSVLRAVENRRPVIRCGNNGWTGWIDELGRIQAVLEKQGRGIHCQGELFMEVLKRPAFHGKPSFFARHGDWFVVLCSVFVLLAFLLQRQYR